MTETLRARELPTTHRTARAGRNLARHGGFAPRWTAWLDAKKGKLFPLPEKSRIERAQRPHGERRRRRQRDARLPSGSEAARTSPRARVPSSSVKGDRGEKRQIELFPPFATRMPSGGSDRRNEREDEMEDVGTIVGWMDVRAIKCRPHDTWEWKADCHVAKCLPPLTDTESASGPIT